MERCHLSKFGSFRRLSSPRPIAASPTSHYSPHRYDNVTLKHKRTNASEGYVIVSIALNVKLAPHRHRATGLHIIKEKEKKLTTLLLKTRVQTPVLTVHIFNYFCRKSKLALTPETTNLNNQFFLYNKYT